MKDLCRKCENNYCLRPNYVLFPCRECKHYNDEFTTSHFVSMTLYEYVQTLSIDEMARMMAENKCIFNARHCITYGDCIECCKAQLEDKIADDEVI